MIEFKKIRTWIESNQISLLIFLISLFIFISFAGTRLFFSDEGIIISQFYNLINGSLALKISKINITSGTYIFVGDNLYGRFSYSLLFLSLFTYYIFKFINILYGFHLIILQLWAASGGIIVSLIAKIRKLKNAELGGLLTYFILIIINLYFFKPIYFPKWGELLAVEFTNILISSLLVLFIFLFFKNFFGTKIGIFASLFVIVATPISFYAITLKHHSLTLFLTILAFYLLYLFQEKKENKYMYFAYIMAGLCIWTRILDGFVLLVSLLITDLVIFRRRTKYLVYVLIVILISLIPLFSLNYLIMGNPLSIVETSPLLNKSIKIPSANDFITLNEDPQIIQRQNELLVSLGFRNSTPKNEWYATILNSLFFKSVNTFGVFLVSPFLIIALAFVIERVKKKIELNIMDKFLGLYVLIFFSSYILLNTLFNINSIIYIITDTPIVLEYRYLLVIYIIFLYFVFRINKIKHIIKNKYKKILVFYISFLILSLIYFIKEFPIFFINIYYYVAIATTISLIASSLFYLSTQNNKPLNALLEKLIIPLIAFSLAEASALMLFYYWVASMTYISPSQNYTILPIMERIIEWMYQILL